MLRGWIEIQLTNGQRLKYVKDVTFGDTGDTVADIDYRKNYSYYEYGNTTGDTYEYQGDSTEIKSNFDTLMANWRGGDSLLVFPEFAGDTWVLTRPNEDEPLTAAPQNAGGDTVILSILAYRRYSVATSAIVSISVVEAYYPQANVYIP